MRPGGLILIDNALWGGSVADPSDQDDDTQAIRALNAKLKTDAGRCCALTATWPARVRASTAIWSTV